MRIGRNIAHSSFVSDVSIYKSAVPNPARFRVIGPVVAGGTTLVDYKLAPWLSDVKQANDVADLKLQYMTAWHGSPHDHNKFDSSKIGTG